MKGQGHFFGPVTASRSLRLTFTAVVLGNSRETVNSQLLWTEQIRPGNLREGTAALEHSALRGSGVARPAGRQAGLAPAGLRGRATELPAWRHT